MNEFAGEKNYTVNTVKKLHGEHSEKNYTVDTPVRLFIQTTRDFDPFAHTKTDGHISLLILNGSLGHTQRRNSSELFPQEQ